MPALLSDAISTVRRLRARYRLARARRYGVSSYDGPQSSQPHDRIRILFYDARGLTFGGTEKALQILAKHLDTREFEVLFMYSPQLGEDRLEYLTGLPNLRLIPFAFESRQPKLPFYIAGMRPHIFDVLASAEVDLVIATGTGYPEYPIANLLHLPIVFINIFGSISPQTNIRKVLCISDYLSARVRKALPNADIDTFYIQSEGPDQQAELRGRAMRRDLGFDETATLFGRIGRGNDRIFDPIGIRSFQQLLKVKKNVHYLIMSPPPELVRIVTTEQIPNVKFLPPSGKESDIWAFHHAIDVLAHFRKDGETMGLNIAESMLCGRPIISHVSLIYNAHLEFLDDSFSRVARIDDVHEYTAFMKMFASLKEDGQLEQWGARARAKAEPLFLVANNIARFQSYLREIHHLHVKTVGRGPDQRRADNANPHEST